MKNKNNVKTWHEDVKEKMTFGQRAADAVAKFYGSWSFIIGLVVFISVYMILNVVSLFGTHFDKYPFILLNLVLGILVLFGAPLIMMSQNRRDAIDRAKADRDLESDLRSTEILEILNIAIERLENDKLDKIIEAVCKPEKKKPAAKKPTTKKSTKVK